MPFDHLTQTKVSNRLFLGLLIFFSVYLLSNHLPFPGTDEIIFKEPAYRLSSGLSYAAPASIGRYPGIEKLAAFYPPVYAFLLSIWYRVFDFSLLSSLSFVLLICLLIVLLLLEGYTKKLNYGSLSPNLGIVFVAWAMILMSGVSRPDPLFVLFGFAILNLHRYCSQPCNYPWVFFKSSLLVGLLFGTSPVLALLLTPLLIVASFIEKKISWRSILFRSGVFGFGLFLAFLLWGSVFIHEPTLFKKQFIDELFLQSRALTVANVFSGLHFITRYGFFLYYLPLVIFLIAICSFFLFKFRRSLDVKCYTTSFVVVVLTWIFVILKIQNKPTYLHAIHVFLLFICSNILQNGFSFIKNLKIRKTLFFITWGLILWALLPFIRMSVIPLTWDHFDRYEANRSLIHKQIPKGSSVLADARFWHLLTKHSNVYDMSFSQHALEKSEYVLFGSGGSGKADAVNIAFPDADMDYFNRNFTKRYSTLTANPNRLLGIEIARSRWCYRFELYERNPRVRRLITQNNSN